MKYFLLLFYTSLFIINTANAQKESSEIAELKTELTKFHRQKVFTILSNNSLSVKQTLFFTSWVINSYTNKPDTFSDFVISEIINPAGNVVLTKLIKIKSGRASGFFYLPDTMSGGTYRLQVKTPFMKNFSEKFLYSERFFIENLEKPFYDEEYLRFLKKKKRQLKRSSVQLFYTNNVLSAKKNAKIAVLFHEKNSYFAPEIITRKKEKVGEFYSLSNDFGLLKFTPKSGQKYYIKTKISEKKIISDRLNLPTDNFINIELSTENNKNFSFSVTKGVQNKENIYLFVIRNSGGIFYSTKIDLVKTQFISVTKSNLPTGLLTACLYKNGQELPVTTCLVKKNNNINTVIKPKIRTNKHRVKLHINGNQLNTGNYLIKVTSGLKSKKKVSNIEHFINFQSEITSRITNYSLKYETENLDFMSIMQDNNSFFQYKKIKKSPKFQKQNKLEISGIVTKELIKLPYENAKVTLYILNKYNDRFVTHTDSKGHFSFKNLDYADTIDVIIEARTKRNKKSLVIFPDEMGETQSSPIIPNDIGNAIKLQRKGRKYNMRNSKYIQENDTSINKPLKLYHQADQVITSDMLTNSYYLNVSQILEHYLPGGSIRGSNIEPLFLIDGTPSDRSVANSIPVDDIDKVEILKSPGNKGIFGSSGVNGVVAIYTKHGQYGKRGEIQLRLLGFAKNKDFKGAKNAFADKRNTIYWNPNFLITNKLESSVEIIIPKNTKEFTIQIQGITNAGIPVYWTKEIYLK